MKRTTLFILKYKLLHWFSRTLFKIKQFRELGEIEQVKKEVHLKRKKRCTMSFKRINGTYDAIFSLGDLCLASIQLRRHNLRPFAGVIDWMGSPSLNDVNRLLKNRFEGFMDASHLSIRGYANAQNLLVAEEQYGIMSNHDFDTARNTGAYLATYPEVKAKFDRRIKRFLNKCETSKRILFVRTEGTFDEILALEDTLSELVKGDFRILVINHTNVSGIVVQNWPLDNVLSLEFPNVEKWEGNNALWAQVLKGVHIR
ncbi:DUF1796 family putative cysteine peptidase [Sporolactobacillus inulinus]|uniref:Peptidase n=2 Tax=Sporolactobacillus inulinus TaxID=2078 RepID=A0A4Y3T4M0_9BACL|nr:DUF1796 family putative cysteine peptidase [Sporolactobacillus inulinus]GAY75484.1 hypothetical protein NBRC111894_1038 [Sporolactobacillus inulinus]GEB77751.1 hypothetical protein SIN01_20960 [Sporolactobacillus inulinus]